MQSECLPFTRIPHTSRLFSDFLYHFDRVSEFFPRPPLTSDWFAAEAATICYDQFRRDRVASVLTAQNRRWGAGERTLENIERFRRGAHVVVTGQQVGLLGGPLFSILKAVSAVRMAREAVNAGVDAIPVFWLATEDHDLEEVNHAFIPAQGTVHRIETASHDVEDAPVFRVRLSNDVSSALAQVEDLLGRCDVTDWIRDAYAPGHTISDAFAMLFARMFADHGVVMIDPSDPELHAVAGPVMRRAIDEADDIDQALLERGKQLRDAGYHEQVKVTSASTLLFAMHDGARSVIRRSNGEFSYAGQKVSKAELLGRIEAQPERFSPNVLLRPVIQDHLLPTLAYIGGPAEVAYFAQAAVTYQKLIGRVTPVLPRFSATLVEPEIERLLKKYGVTVPDCFHGQDELRDLLAKRMLPSGTQAAFETASAAVDRAVTDIENSLRQLDPTLLKAAERSAAKMRYQLDKLKTKAASAEVRRNEVIARHAAQLSAALHPHKTLQERVVAGVYFIARHGSQLLETLLAAARIECPDHQLIHLR